MEESDRELLLLLLSSSAAADLTPRAHGIPTHGRGANNFSTRYYTDQLNINLSSYNPPTRHNEME